MYMEASCWHYIVNLMLNFLMLTTIGAADMDLTSVNETGSSLFSRIGFYLILSKR